MRGSSWEDNRRIFELLFGFPLVNYPGQIKHLPGWVVSIPLQIILSFVRSFCIWYGLMVLKQPVINEREDKRFIGGGKCPRVAVWNATPHRGIEMMAAWHRKVSRRAR